jgi:hypothetical protein
MQNQEMPKQIAITVIEGTSRRGRTRYRSRDEVEHDENVIGVNNSQAMVRYRREWRKNGLEAKVHKDCSD